MCLILADWTSKYEYFPIVEYPFVLSTVKLYLFCPLFDQWNTWRSYHLSSSPELQPRAKEFRWNCSNARFFSILSLRKTECEETVLLRSLSRSRITLYLLPILFHPIEPSRHSFSSSMPSAPEPIDGSNMISSLLKGSSLFHNTLSLSRAVCCWDHRSLSYTF